MFKNLKREIKDFSRFKEIINVFFQGELRFLVEDLNLHKYVSPKTKLKTNAKKPRILVETLEKLGPTFIKLGQLLSIRPDLVPHEYIEELKHLQDEVPPFPFGAVKDVVQRELNQPLTKVFSQFSEKPIAAASTGQVHIATLRDSKKKVAVKVQRPGIKQIINRDIDILEYLARKIDKSKKYPYIDALKIIEEFKRYTAEELDMNIEISRMKKFRDFYEQKKDFDIIIPKVYEEHSTSKLLVMQYLKGTPLTDMASLKRKKVDLKRLTLIGIKVILEQIFELGMFHADAHPGNLMLIRVRTKNKKIVDKLGMLDFGIVGYINDDLKAQILRMFDGLFNEDVDEVLKTLISVGTKKDNFNKELLRKIIEKNIFDLNQKSLEEARLSFVFYNLLKESNKAGLKINSNLVLLGKAYLVLESTGKYLYPKINLKKILLDYFDEHQELFLNRMVSETKKSFSNFVEFAKEIPIYSEHLDEMITKGVKINFNNDEFRSIFKEYDFEMNKKILGTISASLFIGSSLIAIIRPNANFLNFKLYEIGFLMFFTTLFLLGTLVIKTHKYLNE